MDPVVYLGAALAPLPLAPALDRVVRRWPPARPALDGFVLTLVGFLVLLHLVPHALVEAGPWAFAAVALGALGPHLLEGRATRGRGLLALLGVGLLVHVLLDGAALGALEGRGHAHADSHGALGWAVVIHRLPISLFVWWLIVPKWGPRLAAAALALIGALTVVGYFAGARVMASVALEHLGLFEALVGGALLHVLAGPRAHASESDRVAPPARAAARAELAGATAALLLFVWSHYIGAMPTHDEANVAATLYALALVTAPALAVGFGLVVAVAARGRVEDVSAVVAGLAPSVLAGSFAEALARIAGWEDLPTGLLLAATVLAAGVGRQLRGRGPWGPAATLATCVVLGAALPVPPAPVAWVAIGAIAAGFAPVAVRIGPRALVLGHG